MNVPNLFVTATCETSYDFPDDFSLHNFPPLSHSLIHLLSIYLTMKQFTPEQKHSILLEYSPHSHDHSFSALATRHSVTGGSKVIKRWYNRWNGTSNSLQHKKGAGRPRILTATEVDRHIRIPIQKANRSYRPIHYPEVEAVVKEKTGKEVSDRTIRRYGKEELGARQITGKKRTAWECESTAHIHYVLRAFVE